MAAEQSNLKTNLFYDMTSDVTSDMTSDVNIVLGNADLLRDLWTAPS